MAQLVKNLPAIQETQIWSLGWEDSLEEEIPSTVFVPGEVPWTEETGGLQSMGFQRAGHNWATSLSLSYIYIYIYIYIYMKSLYNSISLSYVAFKAKYYKIFECSYNKISIININIYSQIWLAFFSTFLVLSYFSHVQLFETLWSVAHQAPLSMGFSRQEHWGGLPCLLQEIFLTQGLNQHVMSSALAGRFFTTSHHLGSHGILGQKNISNSKNIQFISYWFYDCSKLYPV